MADIRDLETKLGDAYDFIVRSVKSKTLLPEVDSDRDLSRLLCRPEGLREKGISAEAETAAIYGDLIALKEGEAKPTPKLIDGFRAYLGQLVTEGSIEANLITPFKNA